MAAGIEATGRRDFPNFDYLRLAAAACVIFSHSFLIADGNEAREPVHVLTGSIAGIYGVCVFFMISGFLVTQSAVERPSLLRFCASRALRIYPALAMCLLLTGTLLGIAFTAKPMGDFLLGLEPLRYAARGVVDPGAGWSMPSVRFYEGRLGDGINGTLWTIRQELLCYAIVALLMAVRLLRWPAMLLLLGLTAPVLVPWTTANAPWGVLEDFLYVAPAFFAGSLVYFLWARRGALPLWPLLPCAMLLDFAWWTGRFYDLFPLYAAYPVLLFATAQRWRLPSLRRFGDISYGLYLYGWPIQQAARVLLGPQAQWWAIFLIALPAAALAGYLSWHLLEKHALRLKRRLGQPSSATANAPAEAASTATSA